MARAYHTFKVENSDLIKQQMLTWANQFNICCLLDNHYYKSNYNSFECLLGAGAASIFQPTGDFLSSLTNYIGNHQDFIFGHFNYEAKNIIEGQTFSSSSNKDGFPDFFLFVPETVLELKEDILTIGVLDQDANKVFSEITKLPVNQPKLSNVVFTPTIEKEEYLNSIEQLQRHIQHGDCYEINFCQEFRATCHIEPAAVYAKLSDIAPNPFSAFYRVRENYLLCASPERYLKKTGTKIISQPIKGTSARNRFDQKEDELNKTELKDSLKDQTENVIVVDLVRNDLSKICKEGSVVVEELFGIYSFSHVHQMISTVSGSVEKDTGLSDILKATFPMGSMTGAPKRKVMELIKKYEHDKRGIYSGTLGYITPTKDFDFNVVIRSIVYNATTTNISFHTGSAITASSEPEKEYEECLLKAGAILNIFSENKKAE
ncbi:anthranilate synthase component I family protein [Segetibacter aerophilus]|uniref:Para-aminobenzoate synthase n=1 Tax=Segetibacter aerophilus TaxID=670293 RepID=A0A512BF92_9BACT|nr:anthranilate synthase component I family protein [Segetibacter aerophilus]GEO10640.1 para-aminobenzoate synthase [Segetibacter aerophilus]